MKIKAAAMISIASVVFTTMSPVFVDTSDNELSGMEKRLNERAVSF